MNKLQKISIVIFSVQLLILLLTFAASISQKDFSMVIDSSSLVQTDQSIDSSEFSLKKGSYIFDIYYNTSAAYNYYELNSSYDGTMRVLYDADVIFDPAKNVQEFTVTVRDNVPDMKLHVTDKQGNKSISVQCMEIHSTRSYYKVMLTGFFLLFLLTDIIIFIWQKMTPERKRVFLCLSLLTIAAGIPLYINYLLLGDDLVFHLLRIEGLQQGLKTGQFPVRIHPSFIKGYGYATSVFYPELFNVIPALLRMSGFTINMSYKIFLFIINAATAFISYYSFKKIFHDTDISLFGSVIYTLSSYRLIDMYVRAALGETLAMVFLPLVFSAIYLMFFTDENSNEFKYSEALLIVAVSGILQSHILSTLLIVIFTVPAIFIFHKAFFRIRPLIKLIRAAALTFLLNLWFLIPLLQFMKLDVSIVSPDELYLDANSATLAQIIMPFTLTRGNSTLLTEGIQNDMPLNIGIILVFCTVLFFYQLYRKDITDRHMKTMGIFCSVMGLFLVFMTTDLFPWSFFQNYLHTLYSILEAVQFTFRYLEIATIFLCISSCIAITASRKRYSLIVILTISSAILMLIFSQSIFMNKPYSQACYYESLDTCTIMGGEYVKAGTDIYSMNGDLITLNPDIKITDYSKSGATIRAAIDNSGNDEAQIKVPLIYYPCYKAYNTTGGKKEPLRISIGDNSIMMLTVPANFKGSVEITEYESILWRICDIISAVMLLCCVSYLFVNVKRPAKQKLQEL